MKWEEPRIEVQKFIPNEYVAACYEGVCNVNGDIYEDTNKSGHYEAGIVELSIFVQSLNPQN